MNYPLRKEKTMKILTLIIAGMMVFALCACSDTETVIVEPSPAAVESTVSMPETTEPLEITQSVEDIPEYVVNIYYGDDNAENILYEGTVINDLSAQTLMEKLLEKGVFSEKVEVNSFTVDNYNIIHLDLSESFARQINAMGTSGEYIMMGSLVNTVLDAFDADALALTVDGQILETGHSIYDWEQEFYQ